MTKCVNKFTLISVALFSLLLFSCSSFLVPPAKAAEESVQEQALTILNDVVGLDLTKYATASEETTIESYRDVVAEENVRYKLESNGSKLDMIYTFTDGNLRMIDVLEVEGSPSTTASTSSVSERAKSFLSNYQSYSGNSFYGELESVLDTVSVNKNSTVTAGNVKLEVTTSEDSTTFRWTYTVNGVEATSKCVVLGYKKGFLKYYINNWDIYKIGSTDINLSEKEAIDIALEYAKTFSWEVGSGESVSEVKEFNVTQAMIMGTGFCSSLDADNPRSEYPLTLYPMQYVWVSLDKFYPGNVYGIEVILWADTKEICYIKERFSTVDPPADLIATVYESSVVTIDDKTDTISIGWIPFPVLAAVLLGTTIWWIKKKTYHCLSVCQNCDFSGLSGRCLVCYCSLWCC